jgi:hypothetical protein
MDTELSTLTTPSSACILNLRGRKNVIPTDGIVHAASDEGLADRVDPSTPCPERFEFDIRQEDWL